MKNMMIRLRAFINVTDVFEHTRLLCLESVTINSFRVPNQFRSLKKNRSSQVWRAFLKVEGSTWFVFFEFHFFISFGTDVLTVRLTVCKKRDHRLATATG